MRRFAALAVIALIAGAMLWGCSDPEDDDSPNDLSCPLRTSPDSLLAQLVWAYEHEDVDVYLDCLADSFTFFLCEDDWQSDPTLPHFWRLSEEETIHSNMFGEAGDVDSIYLALETLSVDTVSVPDGRGVGWEYEEDVDLRVYIGQTVYLAGDETAFTIRVDPDDVGPNGETLYEVWEWRDLEWTGRAATEQTSWGRIKAFFR